jgi:hypothetical protein
MNSKLTQLTRLNILGNQACPSDQEILNAIIKRYRKRLGYFSIFAAVPAVLASQMPVSGLRNASPLFRRELYR